MIEFLELEHILAMQRVLIEKFGGKHGIRDQGLLESAVAQPRQSAFGEDLFKDPFEKAAAYAFYLSENQPFLDGNKRIATAAALTFLRLNGFQTLFGDADLYATIMKTANKQLTREALADWFRKNCKKKFVKKKSSSRNKSRQKKSR